MYRLVKRKHLYPTKFIFPQNNASARRGTVTNVLLCDYCREMMSNTTQFEVFQTRHQSTTVSVQLQTLNKNKKKLKKFRRYVELLEVNKGKTNQTMASIRNLKAIHLSKFISIPDIKLDQLHKVTGRAPEWNKMTKLAIDHDFLKKVQKSIIENKTLQIDDKIVKGDEHAIIKEYMKLNDVPLSDMDNATVILSSSRWHKFDINTIDQDLMTIIKDSYDKFRRETLISEKLGDFDQAINAGLSNAAKTASFGEDIDLENELYYNMNTVVQEELLDHPALKLPLFIGTQSEAIMSEDLHEELHQEEIHEEEAAEKDTELRPLKDEPKKNGKKNKVALSIKAVQKTHRKPLLKKTELSELEKVSRIESLKNLLASYLEMSISSGNTDIAYQIFIFYRRKGKRPRFTPVRDVKLCNILLSGYAAKGSYMKIVDLLNIMKEDNLDPNLSTYAAIFECIQRSTLENKHSLLLRYKKEMDSKGISLNDLMNNAKFINDQHEKVLAAIRRIDPDFKPIYTHPHLGYVSPLLNDLNGQSREGLMASPADGLIQIDALKDKLREQLRNEMEGFIYVDNIEIVDEPTEDTKYNGDKIKELENEWRNTVRTVFAKNIAALKCQCNVSNKILNIYPYLNCLKTDMVVNLVMSEINLLMHGSNSYTPSVKMLQKDLGTRVYAKYRIQKIKENGVLDKLSKIYEEYYEWYLDKKSGNEPYNSRQKWQTLLHKYSDGVTVDLEENPWPPGVCLAIGKFLYNIILNDLKVDVNIYKKSSKKSQPVTAIFCVSRWTGRICRTEIKVHPLAWKAWRDANCSRLIVLAPLAPTIVPPAPWSKAGRGVLGGYLLTPPELMRMPANVVQQWKRLENAPPETLYAPLDSLNQLGSIPWTINKPILDLLLQVFRSGGSKELNVAQPPSILDVEMPPPIHPGMTKFEKAKIYRKKMTVNRKKAELYSLWCDSLYKLSLANHYRDSIFWLPHNMDFRGRVYSCSPHVTILGGDTARALLKFALPKPLGTKGLQWLKLHAVNLTGTQKKNTIKERLQYAEEVLDDILDSAIHPLDGRRWWAESEDPWQTLACCMEIRNAIMSPNHEEYLCSFPVHQDGSCNGLQHYAALGGDESGAVSVNLTPSERPQDVYSTVVTKVENARQRDAAAGEAIALALDGFITRKVIKQTVMTTVYGVTKFGARLQIAKQLKDMDNFPKDKVWASSNYLTTKTFEILKEMFTSTREIQDWFTECAKLITTVCGESVEWVTPIGLPVVQHYHKSWSGIKVATPNNDGIALLEHTPVDQYLRPCSLKQKNAFPPNFIHSLDSTHMMLTSLQCEAAGLTFVSVHDCFWTHPLTVDQMNKICRDKFLDLHSQPILEDLSKFLEKRYTSEENTTDSLMMINARQKLKQVLQMLPKKGNFKLEEVLKSVYFFS